MDSTANKSDTSREDLNKIPQGHTPGPWTCQYQGRRQWAIISQAPQSDSRRTQIVAEIIDPVEYMKPAENRANGNLMAASPDLLEAARELLRLIDAVQIDQSNPDETDRVFPRYEFDAIRAAVAKAEGKAS